MAWTPFRSTAVRLNTLMLAVSALILIALVALAYREWTEYGRASVERAHTRDIQDSANRLLSSLLDAETGARGFLLTGEARYLQPYNQALQMIPAAFADLNKLLPRGSGQAELDRLITEERANLRQGIAERQARGVPDVPLLDGGKQVMDRIRAVLSSIQRSDQSAGIEASVERQAAARGALLVTMLGSALLLAFSFFGNITVSRTIRGREQALAQTQTARDSLRTTLASIGDAVISTDTQGRILFANRVAQSLLRASETEIVGRPLEEVFRIVNEFTRAKVESPVSKVLQEGTIVGLANHTVLIAHDGTEVPIDDSGAPIRSEGGPVQGTVLVFRDITERRRAEAASRLLAAIVESSEDAIISVDLNGLVTSWNQGAERIFGYAAEQMTGQAASILAAPGHLDATAHILDQIRRGERIDRLQTVHRTRQGDLIDVSIAVSPVYDAGGRIAGASKIIRDITAQVRAQEVIAEQRERLRVTLSSIGDAVMATDEAGRVSYLNPVAEQLTGWTTAEAAGRPLPEIFRIINEETRRTVESPVAKVLRDGQVVGLANHTLLVSRHGQEISIDDSAAPIRNTRGAMLGVVLVFRDISERRAAERALQQSEERYRATFDNAAVGIAHIALDGRFLRFNDVLCEITGYSRQELGGKTFAEITHPEDREADWELSRRVAAAEIPHYSLEKRCLRKDGSIVWVYRTVSLLRGIGEAPPHYVSVIEDVTQRKRLEEERVELLANERKAAAERALAQREAELARIGRALTMGELAASIAHEVNQPLAGVVTNAEAGLRWLGGATPSLDGARESLARIVRDANRASAIIRRIREFLKKEDSSPALVDLGETIREAIALSRGELEKGRIQLRLELPPEPFRVRGDHVQLQQVILNLIMNAREAMVSVGDGNRELLIATRPSADGSVAVVVKDSGTGIDPKDMSRIFDAFFTTKPAGMGMGLSISRSIVEAHGGRMWAELNEGPGLTVQFSLAVEAEGAQSRAAGSFV